MRCKMSCGAVTKTPNKSISYKKWQLCRPCAIKQGLVKPMKTELIHTRMGKGLAWRKGTALSKPIPNTRERQNQKMFNKWMMTSF